MKLEDGKTYQTRNGLHKVLVKLDKETGMFEGCANGGTRTWTPTGCFWPDGNEHTFDLIAPVQEPLIVWVAERDDNAGTEQAIKNNQIWDLKEMALAAPRCKQVHKLEIRILETVKP